MKRTMLALCAVAAGILALPAPLLALSPGFSEDFEGTLSQWIGRGGSSHNGAIVSDPLASGQGGVVHFTSLSAGGDMFASSPLNLTGPVEISFDYLGLPDLGSVPGDLGGFLGIAHSLTPTTDGVDIFWYAGTQFYPGLLVNLADDGAWHRYTFQVSVSQPFHLILEDFSGSGGVAGDAYFDNITVAAVPEPTSLSLALMGLLLAGSVRSRQHRA